MTREFPRSQRVARQIQRELAMYLEKNRICGGSGMLTVSSVKVSPDLRQATVLVTLLGGENGSRTLVEQLNTDAHVYQKHLAGVLRLRVTPRLHFEYDSHLERAHRISDLIDNLDRSSD